MKKMEGTKDMKQMEGDEGYETDGGEGYEEDGRGRRK